MNVILSKSVIMTSTYRLSQAVTADTIKMGLTWLSQGGDTSVGTDLQGGLFRGGNFQAF